MPASRRKVAPRRRRKVAPRRKSDARINSKITTIVETIEPDFSVLSNVATFWSVYLASFPRAMAMANLYEYFRIVKFKVISKPRANMYFNIGAGSTIQAPQMYRVMDRARILDDRYINLDQMVAMGAKPTLFTKDYTVSYKPNTLSIANVVAGTAVDGDPTPLYQSNDVVYGKWIPTTPNPGGSTSSPIPQNTLDATANVPFYGHWQYMQQLGLVAGQQVDYSTVVVCTIQFKNPLKLPGDAVARPVLPYQVTFGGEETFSARPQHGHTGGVWGE